MCGHATLAAAFVALGPALHPGDAPDAVVFDSKSGALGVARRPDGLLELDFPSRPPVAVAEADVPPELLRGLGLPRAAALYVGKARDYLVVLPSPADVARIVPDFSALSHVDALCVIVAAAGGEGSDVTSRVFCPNCGVPEDPVVGWPHKTLCRHPLTLTLTQANTSQAHKLS